MYMVNAIPGQNLPVPNFAYHLPKSWIDRFAHLNGKLPKSSMKKDQNFFYCAKTLFQNLGHLAYQGLMKVVFFLLNTEMLQKGYVREIQDQAKARQFQCLKKIYPRENPSSKQESTHLGSK